MQVRISIGLTALDQEMKRRLLAEARAHLPDLTLYAGHDYTDFFSVDGNGIVMFKRPDNSVDLCLTCDSTRVMYPLVA